MSWLSLLTPVGLFEEAYKGGYALGNIIKGRDPGWRPGKDSTTEPTAETGLSEMAKWLEPFAKKSLTASQDVMEPATKLFGAMASGDPAAMTRASAPGINTIVSQYDAARKTAAEFAPRGGGRNELLAELPFRQAGDIAKLLQTGQIEAASKLPQIASILSQQGLGAAGLSGQDLATLIQQELEKRKQNVELGKGIGQMIAMLIGPLLKGKGS